MNKSTEQKIILYCLNNILKKPSLCGLRRLYDWFDDFAPQLFGINITDIWHGEFQHCETNRLARDYKTIQTLLKGKTGELVIRLARRERRRDGGFHQQCRLCRKTDCHFLSMLVWLQRFVQFREHIRLRERENR